MIRLEEVLEIPTYTGKEDLMVEFIIDFCQKNNLSYYKDSKNNVYVTKGKVEQNEFYPCVVAHTDTVHLDQTDLIKTNTKIKINSILTGKNKTKLMGWNPLLDCPTGIGGDDKCGVYICLKMLIEVDVLKAAFFVEEETGMHVSKIADPSFFKNVGYAIQFDAPTNNWFSKTLLGKELWNSYFFKNIEPVLVENKIDNISQDPYTDVFQLSKKFDFCCAVMPTGYYNQHSKLEYVISEETEQCLQIGIEAVKKMGKNKYFL
jgi:tripeptide aminopeptidase